MTNKLFCAALIALALTPVAHAQTSAEPAATPTFLGMNIIDSKPLNEVWIESGFLSYHWDRDKNLNGNNYGLGGEYRFSTVSAVTVGRFYNSDREYSSYAGVYYQPIQLGPIRLGAVAGGFNGYPHMNNGGWFLAAVPMASAEWGRFGFNLAIVPSLQNRLYGAISLQVKVRVWD
ncbi:hypothetical protein AAKU67_000178 [Oxalobacteraceae bacterium GrIS 2.11]